MPIQESYEIRLEMAGMHDQFLDRLEETMEQKNYVEACWLCYAIFEQRIRRIIEKHIDKCPLEKAEKKQIVAISTKIKCIKSLSEKQYGVYADFDKDLLMKMEKWCARRNTLVHELVDLDDYEKYEANFKQLAICGFPLVEHLYQEATKVREWCRKGENSFGEFPQFKCKCKKYRCIYEGER